MLIRSLIIPLTALALLASACGDSEPQNTPQPPLLARPGRRLPLRPANSRQ